MNPEGSSLALGKDYNIDYCREGQNYISRDSLVQTYSISKPTHYKLYE